MCTSALALAPFLNVSWSRVNSLDIDFLCITGDFVDAPGVSEAGTCQRLRSCQVPIYFSIGNHERYEDLDEDSSSVSSDWASLFCARALRRMGRSS